MKHGMVKPVSEVIRTEITQVGRIEYKVCLIHGNPFSTEAWLVWGKKRAERFAKRKLRKALRIRGYKEQATIVYREEDVQ